MKKTANVTGMTCSACSGHVQNTVCGLKGVNSATVNLLANKLYVDFDETTLTTEEIEIAVSKAGYGAQFEGEKVQEKVSKNSFKVRFIVSLCFLVPLFYISMGHMVSFPLPLIFHHNSMVFALTQLLLTMPIIFLNFHYFTKGFSLLIKRSPNMDSLIAVGTSAAFIYSVIVLYMMAIDVSHAHELAMQLYFESAGMILVLVTLGKMLEERSKGRTRDAISKLLNLAPNTAEVMRNGEIVTIKTSEIVLGDTVIVKPGSALPADGVVSKGKSYVDESALTGESMPVGKEIGDGVYSGTMNTSGYFEFSATKIGEDTAVAGIAKLVEEAGASKMPIAKLADRVSGVFVPIVLAIAAITVITWIIVNGNVGEALGFGISVLVISCPCAVGLATPVAIMVGSGKGAELGILVRSGEALETMKDIKTVIFDKTGTLTHGKPTVTDVIEATEISRDELIVLAASIERYSEHPIARSVCELTEKTREVVDFVAVAGKGVVGKIDGKICAAGNESMMWDESVDVSLLKGKATALASQGKTPLYFAYDSKLIGLIAVGDELRESSCETISELKNMGIKTTMLTGDNAVTANAIAEKIGVDTVISGVMPDGKADVVKELKKQGSVAMVGDGINDAPALALADVGLAVGSGKDIAIESADVVLMSSNPNLCVTAIELSRAVISNIKQNLLWAFFYNCLGIPIAAGVFVGAFGLRLDPMFAAAAMSLSSLFVVTNSLRLKNFKKRHWKNEEIKNINEEIEGEIIMNKTVKIEGMMCSHCTGRVHDVLNAIEGVTATVDLEQASATIEGSVSDEQIKTTIENAGYKVIEIL